VSSLYEKLKAAKTEEDVKDIYIKVLGLKGYSKNLVDIQTKEIWIEAKDRGTTSTYAMFTQLLHYVQVALNKGEYLPPLLAVIDTEKAAIMKTADVLPFLKKKTIQWGKSASQFPKDALDQVSAFIGTYLVSFKISTHGDEFISTVKAAIKSGDIIRTQITPDNLKQVFDKWVEMIGREIKDVDADDYNLLFFADIMSDGNISTHANLPAEMVHKNGAPAFYLNGKLYELGNKEGYRQFWAIYHRPPEEEYRNYLLERRDSLIPINERSFKGAYYTPLHVVDRAYDKLSEVLGKNWQRDYIVWDMCCGVGNLEVKHSNHRNIYMSTLDKADVDVMVATKTCVAATRFQYDYLNDDINEFGQIDYTMTNKIPQGLRDAIAQGKKILVLINPPYAEAANSQGNEGKTDVAKTRIGTLMQSQDYGYASRELFVQFMARIAKEIPTATLAMFSTLKYVNAPNFEEFRNNWNAKYLGGFIVHSKAFDGLNGNFPIGFLVWKTNNTPPLARHSQGDGGSLRRALPSPSSLRGAEGDAAIQKDKPVPSSPHPTPSSPRRRGSSLDSRLRGSDKGGSGALARNDVITEITTEIIDKDGNPIGEKKFFNLSNSTLLTNWIGRQKPNSIEVIPLINAITPTTKTKGVRRTTWAENAIGHMLSDSNDLQNAKDTGLFSSVHSIGHKGGYFVTTENLWQAAVVFSVRRLIKPTWINDRDQFLQPDKPLSDDFKNDCLIWMLFNGSNLTASADGLQWNGRTWSIVNHFIPYTETEVGAPSRFESDFMVQYLADKTLSPESIAVLNAGRDLWRAYFAKTDVYAIREELKLNRADVGWYQIRNALKRRNDAGDSIPVDFGVFEGAYAALSEKLRPMVYGLGFLRA
jgi:hypothetical protein